MPTVLALHAFTRGPSHLAAVSEACNRRGWNCLRPVLAPRLVPILMNDRRHLSRIARRLAASGWLDDRVVIVGHSAGAAAGCWMTPVLLDAGINVRGLVLVDGNDSPNHLIERSWTRLVDVPIRAVMAPPNPCNRHGRLSAFLQERRPGSVVVMPEGGHGDLEMPRSAIYRRVCGDRSGPEQWRSLLATVMDECASLLDGPRI